MEGADLTIKKIQSMREDDFSREIVIPLLKKMGYTFTDFNGGAYEEGKDIIAHKQNEFDELEVIAIQSKMLKSERSALHAQNFSQITYQLRQCIDNKIPCIDGVERYPSKVILITPFPIDTRSLADQLQNIRINRVMLIDESRLLNLLEKYCPEIFECSQADLSRAVKLNSADITNVELYRALHIDSKTNYSDYYSDLNFFVGKTESHKLFKSSVVLTEKISSPYNERNWDALKKIHEIISGLTGRHLIIDSIDEVESLYNTQAQAYSTPENQAKISERVSLRAHAEQIFISLKSTIESARKDSASNLTTAKSRTSQEQFELEALEIDNLVVSLHKAISDELSPPEITKIAVSVKKLNSYHDPKKILPQIESIHQISQEYESTLSSLKKIESLILPHPLFIASIDLTKAQNSLNGHIANVSMKVKEISNSNLISSEIRATLDDTNNLLRAVDLLLNHVLESPLKITLLDSDSPVHEIDISAHKIFDTGVNIAVYGDAGAGKSTTLYVYAETVFKNKRTDEEVLFIPLNRISNTLAKLTPEEKAKYIDAKNCFNSLINAFLLYRDIKVTPENRDGMINILSEKRRVIIVVDALDEATNEADWVIPALSEIPEKIKNSQVITSSRSSVSLIRNIDFLGITLLPFNKPQLQKFIYGWMRETVQADDLWNHIENNELLEVAKNPLLATIICTLHESGIPIPENEPDVYRRKIELLCGLYDLNKGIMRTTNDRNLLEFCARKIAYRMHVRTQREATHNEIYGYLTSALEERIPKEKVLSIIKDLTEACNILIKSPGTDYFSFGHLRIQEALAAEELAQNRAIDIPSLIAQAWWGGALYLYSFKNNIQPIFDEIYDRHGTFVRHSANLKLMISSQQKSMRSSLLELLGKHLRSDDGYDDEKYDGSFHDYDYRLDMDLKNIIGY